ncbi:hypothetical protein AQZ49_19165 [Novosphingobium sp. FSW06-99]|nr:hypothetical protein AQZ49_19165 [Novosphingobium sp. FSW06-99]
MRSRRPATPTIEKLPVESLGADRVAVVAVMLSCLAPWRAAVVFSEAGRWRAFSLPCRAMPPGMLPAPDCPAAGRLPGIIARVVTLLRSMGQ